jgi:hypothetical protein
MIIIVTVETPMGNQTGAIHGFGMRKRTSMVVSFGGHYLIRNQAVPGFFSDKRLLHLPDEPSQFRI